MNNPFEQPFLSAIILDSVTNSYFTFNMALRVLLADESSTIKKVMQLALSDFGVEVKSVPVGVDVLSVAKSFKPDIVFADVLLTKRNGYEVCQDIKNDPDTRNIPVVLMWSGFMEMDEAKATECMADEKLEKPFDADILRSMVSNLVQKTKSNPVSDYLTFPEMPEFEETPLEIQGSQEESAEHVKSGFSKEEDIFTIPEIEEIKFSSHPEIGINAKTSKAPEEVDEGGWAHQDLTKFKIQLPEEEPNDFAAKFVIPQDDELSNAHIEVAGDFEEISFAKPTKEGIKKPIPPPPKANPSTESFVAKVEKSVKEQMMQTLQRGPNKAPPAAAPATAAQPNIQSKMDLDTNMVEKIIHEEAREVIETICWKVLPEIAERIVREELNKILKDAEKSI